MHPCRSSQHREGVRGIGRLVVFLSRQCITCCITYRLCNKWHLRRYILISIRKIGWGCAARFLKPLPCFRPKSVIFPTLFQTCLIISSLGQTNVKGNVYTLLLSRIQNCTKLEAASKKHGLPNSRLECTNHTSFQSKIVKIDTLFQTKTAEKPYPLAPHIAHLREYPPPPLPSLALSPASSALHG